MATQFINPFLRYFNYSGTLANMAGGTLTFSYAGTSDPKNVYSDATGTTSLGDVVTLDATGSAQLWLGDGAYKCILKDSLGNVIDTANNIKGTTNTDQTDSIAGLRALEGGGSEYVFVGGYYENGDGGGGYFYWDATSTASDNAGTIITPNSSPATGRWIRLYDNIVVNAEWFGAKGDGTTDDSASLNAASLVGFVNFQNTTYRLDSNLTINNGASCENGRATLSFYSVTGILINDVGNERVEKINIEGSNSTLVETGYKYDIEQGGGDSKIIDVNASNL